MPAAGREPAGIHVPLLRRSVFAAVGSFSEQLVRSRIGSSGCGALPVGRYLPTTMHPVPRHWYGCTRAAPARTDRGWWPNVERLREHLKPRLAAAGHADLLALNQALLKNGIRQENAGYYMAQGQLRRGLRGFTRLAFDTGHYCLQRKNVAYWLRQHFGGVR